MASERFADVKVSQDAAISFRRRDVEISWRTCSACRSASKSSLSPWNAATRSCEEHPEASCLPSRLSSLGLSLSQELTLYQRRLDLLPEALFFNLFSIFFISSFQVRKAVQATSQQLQRLNEDLGTVKSQLAVLDSEQTRCVSEPWFSALLNSGRLGALEETLHKTCSKDFKRVFFKALEIVLSL